MERNGRYIARASTVAAPEAADATADASAHGDGAAVHDADIADDPPAWTTMAADRPTTPT